MCIWYKFLDDDTMTSLMSGDDITEGSSCLKCCHLWHLDVYRGICLRDVATPLNVNNIWQSLSKLLYGCQYQLCLTSLQVIMDIKIILYRLYRIYDSQLTGLVPPNRPILKIHTSFPQMGKSFPHNWAENSIIPLNGPVILYDIM